MTDQSTLGTLDPGSAYRMPGIGERDYSSPSTYSAKQPEWRSVPNTLIHAALGEGRELARTAPADQLRNESRVKVRLGFERVRGGWPAGRATARSPAAPAKRRSHGTSLDPHAALRIPVAVLHESPADAGLSSFWIGPVVEPSAASPAAGRVDRARRRDGARLRAAPIAGFRPRSCGRARGGRRRRSRGCACWRLRGWSLGSRRPQRRGLRTLFKRTVAGSLIFAGSVPKPTR
jgi:hypothetical protein